MREEIVRYLIERGYVIPGSTMDEKLMKISGEELLQMLWQDIQLQQAE